MIRLATVFSGIGAPEEALRKLGEDFKVVFACDNGERELKKTIEDNGESKKVEITYEEIMSAISDMTEEEKWAYINKLYDETGKPNFVKQSYFANNEISGDNWFEDVRFIDGARYTDKVDILVGGSPCQTFSTYGQKKGFEDTRGTLFFFYAKLIKQIRPKVFIYENVPGLKSHDKGKTWKRIQEIFNDLDYTIYHSVLNASDYGLPQARSRVFVVGFDKSLKIDDYEFPEPIPLEKKATDYLEQKVDLKYYLGKKGFEWVTIKEKHQGRSRVNRDIICCQTANQQFNWTGDFRLEKPTDEIRADKRIYIGKFKDEECVARKLTPTECLRLMGFEDFKIVVNDVNAYRQCGNSIAVPVLKYIFKSIINKVNFN